MRERPLRLLISAGPTREPVDPVRFLSNYSTGFMGLQLAREAIRRKHRLTLVCGPVQELMPQNAKVIAVETARQMLKVMRSHARGVDAVIMAAAVCDFQPVRLAKAKIKRTGPLALALKPTPDILGQLPRRKGQIVAGFALETQDILSQAKAKLLKKKLDLILAQDAKAGKGPFGRNRVKAWLIERGGRVTALGRLPKSEIARQLLDKVEALWYHQRSLFTGA